MTEMTIDNKLANAVQYNPKHHRHPNEVIVVKLKSKDSKDYFQKENEDGVPISAVVQSADKCLCLRLIRNVDRAEWVIEKSVTRETNKR